MGRYIIRLFLVLLTFSASVLAANGQNYSNSISEYRRQYIKDLLDEPRHPVLPGDERYLDFFEPDSSYCVMARLVLTQGGQPFMIHTHSGKNKPFREYGVLFFLIHDTAAELHVYQALDMMNNTAHQEELFVPFNDLTNYEATFGGGRYLDLEVKDLKDGQIKLDFNKCYNPYCAFADGFSCPIPPDENRLRIEIRAGEKMYRKYLGR